MLFLSAIGYYFLFKAPEPRAESVEDSATQRIVDICLQQVSEQAVKDLALQGGYFDVPSARIDRATYRIPFYYEPGLKKVPPIETLELEFSKYVDAKLAACADFTGMERQGYRIQAGKPKTSTTIADQKISIETSYPITIELGPNKHKLEKFSHDFESEYKLSHDISQRLVEKAHQEPMYVDLTFLNGLEQPVSYIPYKEDIGIYVVFGPNYLYMFGVKLK